MTREANLRPPNSDFLTPLCGGEYHRIVREGANFEVKESDFSAAKKRNLLSFLSFTCFSGMYPFIDVGHGGSVAGMIAALDKIAACPRGPARRNS